MISVHALKGGAAAGEYYLDRKNGCEQQLDSAAGYYTGHEAPGRWLGRGAAALGLEGALDLEGQTRFRELLQGRLDAEQIAKAVMRNVNVMERVLEMDVRVSAYDVTLSAPKSYSTFLAMIRSTNYERIHRAHDLAAHDAMTLLEGLSARAARGHHGDGMSAPRIPTAGFIAAAFDHTTSRALDPQVHTHVVVMNLVQGQDGRWSALDSRTLHRQATTASYLYQHLLRADLTREFGIEWGPIVRGVAEIVGVPKEACREFSTRRSQIEAKLTQTGRAVGLLGRARHLAARAACLATRPAKRHVDPDALREDWIRRGNAKGFGPDQADQSWKAGTCRRPSTGTRSGSWCSGRTA